MVLHKSRWATVCTLVAVALLGSMVPTDVLAGKPGGGTADPPPVMYEIQFFDGLTNLADLNNSGMAVGYYNLDGEDRGSLYDPSVPSHAIDLNVHCISHPGGLGDRIGGGHQRFR